ncbi:hypothetical protein [Trichormus sp. NMC-1]|uniref:hypothetical protein n=1 Tax=Trichormus sp. NMC-1 TaxID=1853259 RepID=UPI0008DBFE91|nr:hypothetical protein [Trichormus sp. NMC-1]
METITINSHVGQDGILRLDIPVNISNADLTVTIIVKPSDNYQQESKPKGKGWPANFFEETSGCLKDSPLIIDSEGVFYDLEDLTMLGFSTNPTYGF